ncbi:carbohydrate ABC transporter permease [Streptomyces sp. NBC_01800]|uniref:carbohydrate ABC transporter permease n=1 Tax=Streptomyces sp. NBC_01800 TaxID=2975945 RepID=UPI002DD9A471|nr:carbohydrate ABC transporter permease [Streptomyces sp. NBC_01800]WSA65618.1 carbohydrate ABC transporter permease [Streptomyces sp. NBC_01800]WSA73499.1 carbohydrate ABC transporter permease [Streptomyces sp. NBC_01800]
MRRNRLTLTVLYGSLTVASLIWMVPVVTALAISVLPIGQTRDGWWKGSLSELTLANYGDAWSQGLSQYVVASFVITIGSVAVSLAVGSLASYAFARLDFRFKRLTFFLLLTTMIVPVQIILIPLLPWLRMLGLAEGDLQYAGIILVHTAFGAGWAVFMMSAFFADVPEELLEAARLDGASHLEQLRHMVLPLALPGLVSFAIIDFVFVWNDLLLGLTLLDRDHQPLTVGLANLQSPHLAQENLVSAGSIMVILPPLLLFIALNRFYVRGLFAGGVKG